MRRMLGLVALEVLDDQAITLLNQAGFDLPFFNFLVRASAAALTAVGDSDSVRTEQMIVIQRRQSRAIGMLSPRTRSAAR